MVECVDVYWYVTPNSDTWLSSSNVCRYAPMPPKAVPSFGLEDTTGTRSHGDDRFFGAADWQLVRPEGPEEVPTLRAMV